MICKEICLHFCTDSRTHQTGQIQMSNGRKNSWSSYWRRWSTNWLMNWLLQLFVGPPPVSLAQLVWFFGFCFSSLVYFLPLHPFFSCHLWFLVQTFLLLFASLLGFLVVFSFLCFTASFIDSAVTCLVFTYLIFWFLGFGFFFLSLVPFIPF